MKRLFVITFILALVSVFTMTITSVALAGGYRTPSSGENPHGDYSDSTDKCKVCHAVHNASGEALLPGAKSNACIYCHITGGFASTTPYGVSESNYTTETDWNHDNDHAGYTSSSLYAGCVSCHTVHGVGTISGTNLKNNPGKALGVVDSEIDFCRDCHNKTGDNAVAGGCSDPVADCHQEDQSTEGNLSPEYYLTTRDGTTHIMTTTLTNADGDARAWFPSETCRKCHAAGQPYASADSFPHYTPNAVQFLDDSYTVQGTHLDLVCLNCHTDTGDPSTATSGVGMTF